MFIIFLYSCLSFYLYLLNTTWHFLDGNLFGEASTICFYKFTFYSQILVIPQSSSVKMNQPDEKMFYFVFQVIFLLTCLVTANTLYFVFRRYKVIFSYITSTHFKIKVFIILTKLYIYQDSLPDHKQVIVNILFDHLSLLFQSGNIICGSYIFMVWK